MNVAGVSLEKYFQEIITWRLITRSTKCCSTRTFGRRSNRNVLNYNTPEKLPSPPFPSRAELNNDFGQKKLINKLQGSPLANRKYFSNMKMFIQMAAGGLIKQGAEMISSRAFNSKFSSNSGGGFVNYMQINDELFQSKTMKCEK